MIERHLFGEACCVTKASQGDSEVGCPEDINGIKYKALT